MSLKKFLTVILSATLLTIALSVGVFADTGGEAASVSSWAALQTAVNSAGNGDEIVLAGPIINTANKDRIKVDGKKVTIDLQGNTVDRKRTSSHADGHVFEVVNGAVLTITDTQINSNTSKDDGAGIYLYRGTIEMTGGFLVANTTDNDGGGAKITSKTVFNADGVTISDNTAKSEEGGGVKNQGTTTLTNCTITAIPQ